MSLHIITIHILIICVNVSNLDVFTSKIDIFLLILTAISVHLSQIVMCTKLYCVFY